MILYTPAARQASADIGADILLAMTQVDQVFGGQWFKVFPILAHMTELPFVESGDGVTDVKSFSTNQTVRSLRDQYKADLVALITETGNFCGIAYGLYPMAPELEDGAYSTIRRDCLPNATLPHELGHNIGMAHDRYVHDGGNASWFNYGYVNTTTRFRTIMAYNEQCTKLNISCTRVLTYSSPEDRKGYGGGSWQAQRSPQ